MPIPPERTLPVVPAQSGEAQPRTVQEIQEENGRLSDAIVGHFREHSFLSRSSRDYGDGRALTVSVSSRRESKLDSLVIMLFAHAIGQRGYQSLERVKEHKLVDLQIVLGIETTGVFPARDTENPPPKVLTERQRLQEYNDILKDVVRVYDINVTTSPVEQDQG